MQRLPIFLFLILAEGPSPILAFDPLASLSSVAAQESAAAIGALGATTTGPKVDRCVFFLSLCCVTV